MPKITRPKGYEKPEPKTKPKRNRKGPGYREGTVAGSGPEFSPEQRRKLSELAKAKFPRRQEKKTRPGWWAWWFEEGEDEHGEEKEATEAGS